MQYHPKTSFFCNVRLRQNNTYYLYPYIFDSKDEYVSHSLCKDLIKEEVV